MALKTNLEVPCWLNATVGRGRGSRHLRHATKPLPLCLTMRNAVGTRGKSRRVVVEMKRLLLGAAGLLALAGPAAAADMRPVTKAPPAPTPVVQVYNWTGFYIGGHVGGAFAGNDTLAG